MPQDICLHGGAEGNPIITSLATTSPSIPIFQSREGGESVQKEERRVRSNRVSPTLREHEMQRISPGSKARDVTVRAKAGAMPTPSDDLVFNFFSKTLRHDSFIR